jgi:hypothetical protein
MKFSQTTLYATGITITCLSFLLAERGANKAYSHTGSIASRADLDAIKGFLPNTTCVDRGVPCQGHDGECPNVDCLETYCNGCNGPNIRNCDFHEGTTCAMLPLAVCCENDQRCILTSSGCQCGGVAVSPKVHIGGINCHNI